VAGPTDGRLPVASASIGIGLHDPASPTASEPRDCAAPARRPQACGLQPGAARGASRPLIAGSPSPDPSVFLLPPGSTWLDPGVQTGCSGQSQKSRPGHDTKSAPTSRSQLRAVGIMLHQPSDAVTDGISVKPGGDRTRGRCSGLRDPGMSLGGNERRRLEVRRRWIGRDADSALQACRGVRRLRRRWRRVATGDQRASGQPHARRRRLWLT